MTDKEIIKAFYIVVESKGKDAVFANVDIKKEASFEHKHIALTFGDILDLINRQQAEIERLQNDLAISRKETKRYATRRASECEDCAGCTQWNCDCANERAEAIKEFAERLDRKFAFSSDTQCISAKTIRKFIQDELKEMVGDDK